MYRFDTGSPRELLDIGVVIYRVPPGYLYPSEALNVTQTHGSSPRHDDSGGGDEPENGSHLARQRRGDHGQRKRTGTTDSLEERKRSCTANAVEKRKRAGSTDALEVK
jgi:hypothetical protein